MDADTKNQILSQIINIICGTEPIDERLGRVAVYLCRCHLASVVAIYLVHRRGHRLVLHLAGDRNAPLPLSSPFYTYHLPDPHESLCLPLSSHLPNRLTCTVERDELRRRYPHGWGIPLNDTVRNYGVMALLDRQELEFDEETIRFLQVIGNQLTLALRCARAKEHGRVIVKQLKYLHRLGAWLNAESNIEKVFSRLPDSTPLFFANSLSRLEIFATGHFPSRTYTHGSSDPEQLQLLAAVSHLHEHQKLKETLVVDRRHPLAEDPLYQRFFAQFLLHIILPLPGRQGNLGILEFFLCDNFYSRELLPIQEEELALLEILAHHIAATITRTQTCDRLELVTRKSQQRNRQLTLLHQIKNALLAADTPETIIRLTLGTLCDPAFFSCSPAYCLELGESDDSPLLYAATGNGPTAAGAKSPADDAPDFSAPELTRRLLASQRQLTPIEETLLRALAANLTRNAPPRFHKALSEGKPALLPTTVVTAIDSRFKQLFPGSMIILIPLYEQGEASHLSLAVADHLKPEDLNFITLFTDAAGLALDNTRLYLRLQESLANLNQAQGHLLQSEKLVALGEMAASIAHEIKNPLVSIGGFARRLHKKIPEGSREKTYSRIITKEIERLEEIVNNVLSFTRPATGGFSSCDLNRLIEETAALFKRELKRLGITLQLDLMPTPNRLECDGNQIKQVLINLLNNSIQALSRKDTPGTGDNRIRIRSAAFHLLTDRSEHVLFEIEDNGGGIPETIIHDIFNPFFTTRHDGTGLGLTICYRIIRNHQGEIQLSNQLGKGVKITITLPRHPPKSENNFAPEAR